MVGIKSDKDNETSMDHSYVGPRIQNPRSARMLAAIAVQEDVCSPPVALSKLDGCVDPRLRQTLCVWTRTTTTYNKTLSLIS